MTKATTRLAILLSVSVFASGQSTSSNSPPKAESADALKHDSSNNNHLAQVSAEHGCGGPVDVLSHTQGVNFRPYLEKSCDLVRENRFRLIPESDKSKKEKLAIEFAIKKDGNVGDTRLVASSGDGALDRAAGGGITASNPLPPLPIEFSGPSLVLRFRFFYHDTDHSRVVDIENQSTSDVSTGFVRKSSAEVSISPSSDVQVQTGGSLVLAATVKGAVDKSVTWTITGSGCSGSACGKMKKDTYRAPKLLPNPPLVTLTAISNGDPAAMSSVIVHLVSPAH